MPICLASLPILPGSAAGAAALKYIYIYIYWGGAISVFELHALALPIDFKRSSMKTPAVAKWKITNGGCSWFMTNIAMV